MTLESLGPNSRQVGLTESACKSPIHFTYAKAIDDKLNFSDHIAKTARSCRFALYNIRKIKPFLSECATQLLVQALVLSRLDYCNALLAGLPTNFIEPLQLIQNAAARLIFNEPKRMHVPPLFINLHWLPIAARIKVKALMFAYKTTSGSAPLYLNSVLQTYVPLEHGCPIMLLAIDCPAKFSSNSNQTPEASD